MLALSGNPKLVWVKKNIAIKPPLQISLRVPPADYVHILRQRRKTMKKGSQFSIVAIAIGLLTIDFVSLFDNKNVCYVRVQL